MVEILTVILAILAFLFVAAIVVLERTKPKKPVVIAQPVLEAAPDFEPAVGGRLQAAEQKIVLAHQRIQRIENILAKIPLESLEQRLDVTELQQTVEKLVEFQKHALAKIAVMEQRLEKERSAPNNRTGEKQLDALEKEIRAQDQTLKRMEAKIPVLSKHKKRKK